LLFVHLPRWHLSATQTQQKSSHDDGAASADGIPSGFWPILNNHSAKQYQTRR
jgi:hypothetical protein